MNNQPFNRIFWAVCCLLVAFTCGFAGIYLSEPVLPQENGPAIIYANQLQDDLRQLYTKAIEQSKQSVLFIIYAIKDEKIIQSLRQKSQSGVDVTVICDATANEKVEKKLGKQIKLFKWTGKGIMHQKLLVIDKKQVWIGSSNMTTESLQMHGNLVVAINCPEMAHFIWEKAEALQISMGKKICLSSRIFNVAGQKIEFWFSGDDPQAIPRLTDLLRTAKKTVKVAMFTWTRHDLANEIIKVKSKGINTDIVIDNNSGNGVSAPIVEKLHQNCVPTCLSMGKGLLHHKFMLIDDKVLMNGSTNWTKAAFKNNEDCFVILHDLTLEQSKKMQKLWRIIKLESYLFN